MPDSTALIALFAGLGGLILTQVGTLVPARKDFMAQIKLKREACLEHLASSHCFLARESQSAGVEDFDNIMRGDGRTSRDHFAEYAGSLVTRTIDYWRLLWAERWFRVSHATLFTSIILLILLGAIRSVLINSPPYAEIFFIIFIALEIASLVTIYTLGAKLEKLA